MKHVLALLVTGAVLSGVCAYAAVARTPTEGRAEARPEARAGAPERPAR